MKNMLDKMSQTILYLQFNFYNKDRSEWITYEGVIFNSSLI